MRAQVEMCERVEKSPALRELIEDVTRLAQHRNPMQELIEDVTRLAQHRNPLQELIEDATRLAQQRNPMQELIEDVTRLAQHRNPLREFTAEPNQLTRQLNLIPEVIKAENRLSQQLRPIERLLASLHTKSDMRSPVERLLGQSIQERNDAQNHYVKLLSQAHGESEIQKLIEGKLGQSIREKLETSKIFPEKQWLALGQLKPSLQIASFRSLGVLVDHSERLREVASIHQFDPALSNRIFSPSKYLSNYINNAVQRFSEVEGEKDEAVLQTALNLAESEYSESSLLTESLLESEIVIVQPSSPVIYNLYEEQEKELIFLVSKDGNIRIEDIPSLFRLLKTKEIAEMTGEVLNLVATCNQESRAKGGEDIFKPTNAMLEAAADLPMLIVKNKESLVSLIRHLFRLLYEGAGSNSLRFLSVNGGCLENEECDAIWNLKALRNKLTLHDPEHGSPGDIRKSYVTLREALAKLGLSGMPVREDEFLALQKSLLSQVKDFLAQLAIKLRK